MRRARPLAIVLLVTLLAVFAGCITAPQSADARDDGRITLEPAELEEDRPLGEVNGYAATDTLDVNANDVSEADLEAIKYRTMARIEEIRGLQFRDDVAFEIVTRERYREEMSWTDGPAGPFTNEVWRASFVVDGETDYNAAFEEVFDGAVVGYYANGRFVLVVEDLETIRVDRVTLVHELVHALQDQHFGLAREGTTVDEVRAENGLIEGEGNYLPHLYDRRCGEEWQCLADLETGPETESESESGSEGQAEPGSEPAEGVGTEEPEERSFNVGLFLSVYAPYTAGPPFVEHQHRAGGWEAVDAAFEDRPVSTEQVIHPDRYPDVRPVETPVEDRSGSGWEPFTAGDGGEPRTETVGEATLFATLFANGVIDRPIDEGGTALSPYNYSHPLTDGWAGDTLVAYHDADDENRTGHVWHLTWKSDEDAAEFRDAYLELLENRGGEAVDVESGSGSGSSSNADADSITYRIPDDRQFAGAYHVSLEGETVTIVGGPTRESLGEIHEPVATTTAASISVSAGPTGPTGSEGPAGLEATAEPSAGGQLPEATSANP